jgi:hypothetical protein
MTKPNEDGATPGANRAPPDYPETPIVHEAEKQVAAAVAAFNAWRNEDIQRLSNEVIDTADHLVKGLRLTLSVGKVAESAVGRFEQARRLVEGEMRQHQFSQMDEDSLREIAAPLDQRHTAMRVLITRHAGVVMQASAMFDDLSARFWQIHPIQHGASPLVKH